MTLKTRRPTGKPSWPITLLAGAEKAGKSWACAQASASDLVGRTLWIGIGEDDPDEYGVIPGADFEIVEHDGTYRGILAAITEAQQEPQGDLPTLIVVDSMTRLWQLISGDMQTRANDRARVKAEKYRKPIPAEDVQITMDLWNVARDQWEAVIDVLRAHQGPVLVTARLEEVTVMDSAGKPTTEREFKVQAHKSLPYDVGAIVELPQRGQAFLRGLKSAHLQLEERVRFPKFDVDTLWRRLGLADAEIGERRHATARGEQDTAPAGNPDPARDWIAEGQQATTGEELAALYEDAKAAGADLRRGSDLWTFFGQRMSDLRAEAA